MHKSITNAFIYEFGIGVGILSSMKYFKNKYEAISKEEIASVKNALKKDKESEQPKPEIKLYSTVITETQYGFNGLSNDEECNTEDEETVYIPSSDEPSIVYEINTKSSYPESIDPDVFGDIVGYDKMAITYFADGIFADDSGNAIENIDDLIGLDNIHHFGEYDDGALFIRNDMKQMYYEIYMDKRQYSEVYYN